MTERTLSYYQNNGQQFIANTKDIDMSAIYHPFIKQLSVLDNPSKANIRILDVGCGSGRDAHYFASMGYKVTAIDGSQILIDWASRYHLNSSKLNNNKSSGHIDWHCLTFDKMNQQPWQKRFTGIWACASLLHVPYNELVHRFNDLFALMSSKGVLYASFKYGDRERVDDMGRFFCDMNQTRWQSLKQQMNQDVLTTLNEYYWITEDKRPDRDERWFNILLSRK